MKYSNTIIALLLLGDLSYAQEKDAKKDKPTSIATVSYDVHPGGTVEKPLVLRTYCPDPGLDDAVLGNHGKAAPTPKYSPRHGKDVKGTVQPIDGIPAAIAVNHGEKLSYVWDTTECRLLYAWKGGFLDMSPYWGGGDRGQRKGFGYTPKLDGVLTYLTKGYHPIHINGKPVGIPHYLGHSRKNNLPTFRWSANNAIISTAITTIPESADGSLRVEYRSEGDATISYKGPSGRGLAGQAQKARGLAGQAQKARGLAGQAPNPVQIEQKAPNHLIVTIQPDPTVAKFSKKKEKEFKGVTLARGEHLFTAYSCATCHSLDGGKNHGPTIENLYGSKRMFGDQEITADDSYLYESIAEPNAKIVPGYQPNFMPQLPLSADEINSIILYLRTFSKIHD